MDDDDGIFESELSTDIRPLGFCTNLVCVCVVVGVILSRYDVLCCVYVLAMKIPN